MPQTTARVKKQGKSFEILVDLDGALNIRRGLGNINNALLTDEIFYNIKSGEKASSSDLEKAFGTTNIAEVAKKIINSGELELLAEYIKKKKGEKFKQVVDFLARNATDQNGKAITSDRIEKILEEARVEVKNKPVESQIKEIIEKVSKIIPIKLEMKKLKITIPAQFTGQAYGVINEFKQEENWLNNGDLEVILNIPAGLVIDFYDKLNGVTHGAALSEEMK